MKAKLKEWAKRYIPAEIFASICALAGASLSLALTHSPVAAALGGTWGENLGYYGRISYQDVRDRNAKLKGKGKRYGFFDALKNVRNIILEFGPAEILDSFFIRPFWMWFLPIYFNNFTLGIIIAKFAADVTFYAPTIISYELRKKHLKD